MFSRTLSLYRTSFSGLSTDTWLLSLVMLINRAGTMVMPFMTLYLTTPEMGYSLSKAGTVLGIFGVGSVVGAFLGGWFTDKAGFYSIQIFTLFIGGIFFIVLGQLQSYPMICACTFVLSAINEAFRPANNAAIAHYSEPANRTRSYSLNRLAINLGWAVGTSVGGLLAGIDYKLLFWVDGFTNIGAAAVLLFALKPVTVLKTPGSQTGATRSKSAYRDKIYLCFIVLVTLFAITFFQLFTTIPKYFRDNLHLTESFIGMIMAVNGLIIVVVEMVLVYKLEGRRHHLYFIAAGVFICALAFPILLIPGPAAYIALAMIIVLSFGEIVGMPFMSAYWVARADNYNRGQYAALFTISWGVAQSVGPAACAVVADHFGFDVLFISMSVLLCFVAFLFLKLLKAENETVSVAEKV